MSMLNSIKDVVVGQAVKLASNPRVTRLASDPRLMNCAMKAMSLGGSVKANVDKVAGMAAGAFGFATQEEVAGLRATIQTLEDTIAGLEAKAAASLAPAATPASEGAAKKSSKTARS